MTLKLPESLNRGELKDRQEARLRQLIAEVLPRNTFWAKRFAAVGLKPHDLWTLDDLAQLPLTAKQSLVEDQLASPPYGTNLTGPPKPILPAASDVRHDGCPPALARHGGKLGLGRLVLAANLSNHGRDGRRRGRLSLLVRTVSRLLGRL